MTVSQPFLTHAPLVTIISYTVLFLSLSLCYTPIWELSVSVIKNELYNLFRANMDIYYFKGLLKGPTSSML